jgi:hypothetical protein
MAMIVAFPEMQVPERRRSTRRDKPSAEIILFPGVRYERWADAPGDHEPARATIKRDRLQLIE